MNICLIGKFFPIQGGVSKDNQWVALSLAKAGFQVHVVTNAEEVESQYRCLNWSPLPPLPLNCPGSISVHTTDKAQRRHYIPYANPFVTKLASLATTVIRTYHCELIYSYYLEPYAIAASLASHWTGIPYGLRHAGSDVGALFQSPELQAAYREVILTADYLVVSPATYRRFLHLGVTQDKLYFPVGTPLPPDLFTPNVEPLDVNALLAWMQEHLPVEPYYDVFRRLAQKAFDPTLPRIGIYGKVGEVKGSFDLVYALARLHAEGCQFQFLALLQGSPSILAQFVAALDTHGLAPNTWLLPFLPHWSIPQFIRACTAICFLERDFPIPIHTPLIPQEVFACGTCQVLSHEIADKQPYRERLQHGKNVFLVDPHHHEELAAVSRAIIHDPQASQDIGRQGFYDMGRGQALVAVAEDDWPRFFARLYTDIQHRRQLMSLTDMQAYLARLYTDDCLRKLFVLAPDVSFEAYQLTEAEKQALRALDQKLLEYFAASLKMKHLQKLRSAYPATFALPRSLVERLFHRFYHDFPAKPREDSFTRIIDFGLFLEQALAFDDQAPPYASEVARYERLHYLYLFQPTPEDALTAINTPGLPQGAPLRGESLLVMRPGVYRERFTYPMVPLIEALCKHQAVEACTQQHGQHLLLFQREPHSLTLNVYTLTPDMDLVLDLCQHGSTMEALISKVEHQLGEADLADELVALLALLQDEHIIEVRHGYA